MTDSDDPSMIDSRWSWVAVPIWLAVVIGYKIVDIIRRNR